MVEKASDLELETLLLSTVPVLCSPDTQNGSHRPVEGAPAGWLLNVGLPLGTGAGRVPSSSEECSIPTGWPSLFAPQHPHSLGHGTEGEGEVAIPGYCQLWATASTGFLTLPQTCHVLSNLRAYAHYLENFSPTQPHDSVSHFLQVSAKCPFISEDFPKSLLNHILLHASYSKSLLFLHVYQIIPQLTIC